MFCPKCTEHSSPFPCALILYRHQMLSRLLLKISGMVWFTLSNIRCLNVNLGSSFTIDCRSLRVFFFCLHVIKSETLKLQVLEPVIIQKLTRGSLDAFWDIGHTNREATRLLALFDLWSGKKKIEAKKGNIESETYVCSRAVEFLLKGSRLVTILQLYSLHE